MRSAYAVTDNATGDASLPARGPAAYRRRGPAAVAVCGDGQLAALDTRGLLRGRLLVRLRDQLRERLLLPDEGGAVSGRPHFARLLELAQEFFSGDGPLTGGYSTRLVHVVPVAVVSGVRPVVVLMTVSR